MRKQIVVATGAVAIALGVYIFAGNSDRNEPAGITGTPDIKQLVVDYSSGKLEAKSASITSKQLIVNGDESNPLTYELPGDEFFLSIAPYVNKTHPCETHSLTGCQGEMTEEEFKVHIVDKDGNEIMDTTLKSQDNGFIDLWLRRDQTYQVTVEQNGKVAESEISTFESDNTCIADMKLL